MSDLLASNRDDQHADQDNRHVNNGSGGRLRLRRQFRERLVEPNSGLGQAIQYMLNHWKKLTQFLKTAGAPLDNNICERALKLAILHRKNALFYKTAQGAHVGDIFMSLIHTCRLCGVDPFDYLTQLHGHAAAPPLNPARWMPWTLPRYARRPSSARRPPPLTARRPEKTAVHAHRKDTKGARSPYCPETQPLLGLTTFSRPGGWSCVLRTAGEWRVRAARPRSCLDRHSSGDPPRRPALSG